MAVAAAGVIVTVPVKSVLSTRTYYPAAVVNYSIPASLLLTLYVPAFNPSLCTTISQSANATVRLEFPSLSVSSIPYSSLAYFVPS